MDPMELIGMFLKVLEVGFCMGRDWREWKNVDIQYMYA